MSNYTIAVNWSGKDGLSDSDAAKVISGADFNTEFTAVRTGINSKADLNGNSGEDFALDNGTIAGNVTAPTQTQGNNTTRLATTAFVTTAVAALDAAAINNIVYPVGSIYTNMAVATNPATLLGMGTWVAYATGRVLVGKHSSGTFDALDEELGAETTTLTVANLPAHTHTVTHTQIPSTQANVPSTHPISAPPGSNPTFNKNGTFTTDATGSGTGHSNLQPSVTVHMWKRTA